LLALLVAKQVDALVMRERNTGDRGDLALEVLHHLVSVAVDPRTVAGAGGMLRSSDLVVHGHRRASHVFPAQLDQGITLLLREKVVQQEDARFPRDHLHVELVALVALGGRVSVQFFVFLCGLCVCVCMCVRSCEQCGGGV
jgi:hypothetical protein